MERAVFKFVKHGIGGNKSKWHNKSITFVVGESLLFGACVTRGSAICAFESSTESTNTPRK